MAFVNESERDTALATGAGTGALGPGEYYNEGYLHKQAIEAIYPRKAAPFNSMAVRRVGSYSTSATDAKNISPGPGAYNLKSNFDIVRYVKNLDDRGTYLQDAGGQVQRRRQ
jgi:hypothetical protein